MTRLIGIILLLVALFAPLPASASTAIEVTATAYTCEQHPDNPMNAPGMCLITAHGGDPHQPGIACPDEWRGRVYFVPGHGKLICDDVPYRRTLYGRPHVDIRVPDYYTALAVGIGPMWIYQIEVTPGERAKGDPYAGIVNCTTGRGQHHFADWCGTVGSVPAR